MPPDDIFRILEVLERSGTRYVVAGGVAVVLHGHLRHTADLDLVLAFDRENVLTALSALQSLGYRPRPPVAAEGFADAETRNSWIRDKGMTVFSLWSAELPGTGVDLFAEHPIPFDELESRAARLSLPPLTVPVASIRDLITMKRQASRPRDLADIEELEKIELSLKRDGER